MFCAGYQSGRIDTCAGDSGNKNLIFTLTYLNTKTVHYMENMGPTLVKYN